MDARGWLSDSFTHICSEGLQGVRESMYPAYKKGLHQLFRVSKSGEPIYEREWDLLIILDACRVDLMKEVQNDFEFITNVDQVRSVDTMTREWMRGNFNTDYADEMAETVYICGNPLSQRVLAGNDFKLLDEVWKYSWDDTIGTLPPRPITDRAILAARSRSPNRMIVHYMQPHYPFIPQPELDHGIELNKFGELPWDNVWDRLRKGELEQSEVWDGYRDNLLHVLNDVELLLRNIDKNTVIITSDHGNGIGEWGVYGHPIHIPIDEIQSVPWIMTTAMDEMTRRPDEVEQSSAEVPVEEQLKHLGYRS